MTIYTYIFKFHMQISIHQIKLGMFYMCTKKNKMYFPSKMNTMNTSIFYTLVSIRGFGDGRL